MMFGSGNYRNSFEMFLGCKLFFRMQSVKILHPKAKRLKTRDMRQYVLFRMQSANVLHPKEFLAFFSG